MKLSTFKKRLEKLADATNANKNDYSIVRVHRSSSAYKLLSNWDGKKIIRPCWYNGSGRYTTVHDDTDFIGKILTAMKVRFGVHNDAPRKGLYGNFIEIVTKIDLL